MKSTLVFALGAVVFGLTFAAWFYLNALACGMNTTGCKGVSLKWGDFKTLIYFLPTFILGLCLMARGVWRFLRR